METTTISIQMPVRCVGKGYAAKGRTLAEACAAGNFYLLERDGRDVGEFPGALTVQASVACAVSRGWVRDGDTLEVLRHCPESKVGCAVVEPVGKVVVKFLPPVPPKVDLTPLKDKKSTGHITFHGIWEYFEQRGEVYCAKRSDPLTDSINKARHGRWECTRAHFERFRSVILAPIQVET